MPSDACVFYGHDEVSQGAWSAYIGLFRLPSPLQISSTNHFPFPPVYPQGSAGPVVSCLPSDKLAMRCGSRQLSGVSARWLCAAAVARVFPVSCRIYPSIPINSECGEKGLSTYSTPRDRSLANTSGAMDVHLKLGDTGNMTRRYSAVR
jgi:hypothetical protein